MTQETLRGYEPPASFASRPQPRRSSPSETNAPRAAESPVAQRTRRPGGPARSRLAASLPASGSRAPGTRSPAWWYRRTRRSTRPRRRRHARTRATRSGTRVRRRRRARRNPKNPTARSRLAFSRRRSASRRRRARRPGGTPRRPPGTAGRGPAAAGSSRAGAGAAGPRRRRSLGARGTLRPPRARRVNQRRLSRSAPARRWRSRGGSGRLSGGASRATRPVRWTGDPRVTSRTRRRPA